MQLAVGLIVALVISYAAFRARSLNREGAFAAAALGTLIFAAGGWQWATLMIVFFVGSSALSHLFQDRRNLLSEKYAKGGRRDASQVLGNGGVAAVFVVLHVLSPGSPWPWLGYASALAAANADTWATEMSLPNKARPRLITQLRLPVDAGTSGAVSGLGTLAALAGSVTISLLGAAIAPTQGLPLVWPIILGGFVGALFDSFLGATVQTMFVCSKDGRETEQHPLHRCGSPTLYLRGWRWLSNDWVNVGCGAAGAITAFLTVLVSRGG